MTWSTFVRCVKSAPVKFWVAVPLLAVCALAAPGRTRADYTCARLDVPGSLWTQAFQINAAGQVATASDLGAWIYTGADWQQILPPAGSGYTALDLGALGINDFGAVVGLAGPPDGSSSQGFIASGGTFRFFSVPLPGLPFTAARSVGNNGVVVGIAQGNAGEWVGFAYNPLQNPSYLPGFTHLVPTLSNGTRENQLIVSGMNGLGQFVGSVHFPGQLRFAFVYDPGWQSHGAAQLMTLFRIEGRNTAARGINDWGRIVGFVAVDDGSFHGVLRTNLRDRPLACPGIPGVVNFYPQSINNRGVVTGGWDDGAVDPLSRGFIAYPDPADDLADLLAAVQGVGPGKSLEALVRRAQSSFAAGNEATTCEALRELIQDVTAHTGKKIEATLARALTAEARATAAEVGCQPL